VHPLHLSTTFEREKESLELKNGYIYSRIGNPTRKSLEDTFAKLEFGTEGFAFSSGMQACTSLITAAPETHILIPDDLYHGVAVMAIEVFSLWGLTYEKIDMTDANLVQQKVQDFAMDSTHQKRLMLWMETPSNPQCKVTDIAGLCALVKSVLGEERVTTVVDATWSTPYLLNPLNLGADFVMHSTTKYVAGHSDVLSGVIVANSSPGAEAILPLLRICHQVGGGVCGPLEAYLTLRGLRTLPVRMRQHCKNAMTVAQFLEEHASIEQVFYPGLSSHPQHDLATEQMGGLYGGMLSFLVKPNTKDSDGEEEAFQVGNWNCVHYNVSSNASTTSILSKRQSNDYQM
jgi:cystathionine gamma-synthase